ncbi:BPI protein, partial [Vidua macroura]|nr:BPI protein [Vidua macroura]
AQQQGIAILEKELAQLTLPDISGDSRVLHVGKVRYSFSSCEADSRSLLQALSLTNISFLSPSPCSRGHGSFNLKVENVYMKIILRLGSDTTGKPTISTSDCSARISKVRVRFSGKLGWLYNLFHRVIESKLRKNLERKVCDNVVESVQNELQTYIRTLRVTARIDDKIGIDYSLVAPPRATAQSLDADLKGEFYSLAHRSTVPFSPLPLAFPSDHERMVYFGASSYFFNTAGIAYHKAGALVFEITEAMIPKESEFGLDTSAFSAFIPQLEEMYPNMPMKFRLSTPTAPFLTIGPGGISFQPIVDAQAYAILPNSSLAPLFLLSLVRNVSAVINVRSGRIVGSLDVGRIRLSLKDSAVGHFQVRMMQSLTNILTSSILLPRLNGVGRATCPNAFSLQGCDGCWAMQLPGPVAAQHFLSFSQNFLLLGADVRFQPQ